jgi:protein TonB
VPGEPAAPAFAGERLAGVPGSDAPGARTGFEEGTSEEEISPWLREHYREIVRRIRARILDEQYYPWSIRVRWREGHVRVSFTLRNDGTPSDVRVAASSGHRDLDRCAIAAVRDAGPFPRPPRDEAVVVPITFVLL